MAEQNKAEKFVFYMYKMTKSYPPNKEVLKDISLSFYYGAKNSRVKLGLNLAAPQAICRRNRSLTRT